MSAAPAEHTSTLVAARPGLMRDSLLAFLRASAGIQVVSVVDEPTAALEGARRCRPHTLVADADLSEEAVLMLVQQLKDELPALNSVVLVNSLRQQRAFLAAGAGHVLLKGHLDQRLRAAVWNVSANKEQGRER